MKTVRYLPLLLILCIGPALADTPINLRHPATADARISVSNVKGQVTITAWDRNEVQVTGTLGQGAAPLAIEGDNGDLEIRVKPKGNDSGGWFDWNGDNSMGATTLDLHVPKGASLEVEVVSAPLAIDGMDGGDISVNSVSGRVRIDARTPDLSVESVSGTVQQSGHAERADLQTVSGDILAPALGAKADLQTVSGRIQARGGPWQKFNLSTVSGDVQLGGGVADHGSIDIDSMSGDVQIQVPANLSAAIHASSFSGDLRSDFGKASEHEHGPGSELSAEVGGSSGRIHVETFSGDLRIRKQD
ncbi:DUF4097 family beta strand repeat-containing protein [Frateuria hangzhouensis]|uniref:DUF4097 family beta strand repeat-containing protein n=1 Tax=Frateuria hangzhouensis TaxID=2995589 RepID=UPI0022609A53|nr:DUF4097 family beta strand repeat-containing protein [Frateuria sp. STR12]MCX7512912.1 DUF4097 family beta strand repeat-containing protein [Frateuria sp. STR12]